MRAGSRSSTHKERSVAFGTLEAARRPDDRSSDDLT